jgi:integrase
MKLTTALARNLEPPNGKTDHFEWDDNFPGFGVRLRVGRNRIKRTWIYQYDIGRHTRRITLGNVNAISIQDARKTAGEISGKVRLGRDPMMEKAESRDRAALTFAVVMDRYVKAAKPQMRALSYEFAEYRLRVFCKPLHSLPFISITRRQIAAVLSPIAARGSLQQYNNVRAHLSALFAWAIGQGLTESNPVVGTIKYERKRRKRVLSVPELAVIWHALDDVSGLRDYNAKVRLLMLTGLRRAEIGNLRWCEVHNENFTEDGVVIPGPAIVLPGERAKNGLKHIVPLSKPAQAILAARLRDPDDDFVFQSRALGTWGRCKRTLDAALIKRGHNLTPWVLHDLRRSVATHMGELGIQPHVIEMALNHVSGFRAGVAGIYNRSKLEEPKRQALAAWAEHLMAHVEDRVPSDKVVPLRA